MKREVLDLDPALVSPRSDQPRRHFGADALKRLAASIDADGQAVPILVRRHPKDQGRYEIIGGERRWRAISEHCTKTRHITAVRVDVDSDESAYVLAFVENENRKDLEPIDRCEAVLRLYETGMTQARIAELAGVTDAMVNHWLSVARMAPEVKALMSPERPERDRLGISAAMRIARTPKSLHLKLAREAVKRGVSIADLDAAIASTGGAKRTLKSGSARGLRTLLTRLCTMLGDRFGSFEAVDALLRKAERAEVETLIAHMDDAIAKLESTRHRVVRARGVSR